MLVGRFIGLVASLTGVALIAVSWAMVDSSYFGLLRRVVIAGPFALVLGVSMLLLPGPPDTFADFRDSRSSVEDCMGAAPFAHKVVWAVGGVAGIGLGFYLQGILSG